MRNVRNSLVYEKAFRFAVRAVNLNKFLCHDKKEFILSKQVVRSGTSIGANIREALDAQSKKDFVSKLSIALKETCETEYWIELLVATEYIDNQQGNSLLEDLTEILKMLNTIIKSTKENLNKN